MNRNLGKLTVDFVDNTIVSDAKPIEPLRTVEFDGLRRGMDHLVNGRFDREGGKLLYGGWSGDRFRPMACNKGYKWPRCRSRFLIASAPTDPSCRRSAAIARS